MNRSGEGSGDLMGGLTEHTNCSCKLSHPGKSVPHYLRAAEQETAAGGIYFMAKGVAAW